MNAGQQRFLTNRLDEARRSKPSRYDAVKLAEPKSVVRAIAAKDKAEKVIKTFQKARDAAQKRRNAAIDTAFNKAKTAILFSTTEEAIAAIEKFEKAEF